jgi:hypothetical protein
MSKARCREQRIWPRRSRIGVAEEHRRDQPAHLQIAEPDDGDRLLRGRRELGPPPYAISRAGGAELSDRWQEALTMKAMIRALWQRILDGEAIQGVNA